MTTYILTHDNLEEGWYQWDQATQSNLPGMPGIAVRCSDHLQTELICLRQETAYNSQNLETGV